MGIKAKILFSVLITSIAAGAIALTFFALSAEGSTPTYPFTFPSSGYECSTYEQCYDYCANTVPGSGLGDGSTCDDFFPGAIDDDPATDGDSGGTGESCG
ncbi:MAG: hypothetical protein KAR24_01550, partial [Candidatus Pacebacteria bacterium]|nr:hypothetical protein [Candidatus Paceibacterota bacterium]